ncbi:RNA polymerase sigma-70 factor [Chitinophaga sp. YIM B06452]|uniref:RNA polymerase sigma factor n=1 Tax=Chitinophaga sp. YIM B06452 TaxID=3082158 RepID=UPI0031FF350B
MSDSFLHTENNIFQLVADGDHDAFTRLVDQYWNNLYGQAMAYLKDSHKAQDVVQEVFLAIWKNRDSLPGIERPEHYLYTMAKNRILSEFRKKLLSPIPDHIEQLQPASGSPADEQLAAKQLRELVQAVVDQMPPQRRVIFELSRQEGLKYEEIAARLGISRETVKGHMVKALAQVRTFLRHALRMLFQIFF